MKRATSLPNIVVIPLAITALVVTSVTMTTVTDAYVDKIRQAYNGQQAEACYMRETVPIYDQTGLMIGCDDTHPLDR